MTAVIESPVRPEPLVMRSEDRSELDRARRRKRLVTSLCILAYAALALAAFWPAGPLDSSGLPSAGSIYNPAGGDPYQMAWFLAWLPYALTHGLNLFHTSLFDYPTRVNLADNTAVTPLALLGWPVTATLGPVATFNFLLRLAFALSATSMFLVLRRWCTSTIAPFLGGLLYAFGPYMAGQELHLDLVFVPIPPLLVWCADELVRTQRMRPGRLGLLGGAAAAIQLLISPDVFSGCLVLGGVAGVVLAVRHRRRLRRRLRYVAAAVGVGAATFTAISGYLIFEMIAGPGHFTGAVIPSSSLQGLHADLLGLVVPTSNQLLAPGLLSRLGNEMVAGNLSENGTYLGLPLVLLLVAIYRRSRRDAVVRCSGLLALASFVISLGSRLSIGTLDTHIPLPELLFAHIPLLDNTIPARYGLYQGMFASIVLAIGLDRLWLRRGGPSLLGARVLSRLGRLGTDSATARRARVGLVAGVAVLSLLPSVPFPSQALPWPSSLIRGIRRLVPPGAVVLTYPYPTPLHPGPLLWEARSGMDFHLLGGYANIFFDKSGHRWPELLSPPYVQELLGFTINGDKWPAPGPVDVADIDALHVFVTRYSVGAVVYWAGGDDSVSAYVYLATALGPPTFSANDIAIWLPVRGRWRWPQPQT